MTWKRTLNKEDSGGGGVEGWRQRILTEFPAKYGDKEQV